MWYIGSNEPCIIENVSKSRGSQNSHGDSEPSGCAGARFDTLLCNLALSSCSLSVTALHSLFISFDP